VNLGSEVSDDLDVIPKIRSFRSAGLGWLTEGFADKRVTDEEVNLQGMDLVPGSLSRSRDKGYINRQCIRSFV